MDSLNFLKLYTFILRLCLIPTVRKNIFKRIFLQCNAIQLSRDVRTSAIRHTLISLVRLRDIAIKWINKICNNSLVKIIPARSVPRNYRKRRHWFFSTILRFVHQTNAIYGNPFSLLRIPSKRTRKFYNIT